MKSKDLLSGFHYDGEVYSLGKKTDVSYPEEGNQACYEVEDKSFWFKHRNQCILEAANRFSKRGTFLDVGGGNGFVAKALQDDGYDPIMIEPYRTGCLNARKRGVINVVEGILNEETFPNNSFDTVGAFDVLEHIEDRQTFLSNLKRVVKSDGKIILTVPALQSLWSQEDMDAGHYLRYTQKTLKEEVERAGFQVSYSTYLFSVLPLPLFLIKALPYKLGLRKNTSNLQNEHNEQKLISSLLKFEEAYVRKSKKVNFGTSVLTVLSV